MHNDWTSDKTTNLSWSFEQEWVRYPKELDMGIKDNK